MKINLACVSLLRLLMRLLIITLTLRLLLLHLHCVLSKLDAFHRCP